MTNDGVLAASGLLGVQTLPLVLGVGPQQDSVADWTAAQDEALAALRGVGLVDSYDEVEPDLAAALYILSNPDRELVSRVYTAEGARRVCLARRGAGHAVATRIGDTFDIRTTWADDDPAALTRPLLTVLGAGEPAPITSFSAPSTDVRERLDAAAGADGYAQVLYELGIEERTAIEFGLAIATCSTHAEIVAYAHGDGIQQRSAGAVAVYDTDRGRIVASPGVSPDSSVWSTFAPGTDHRLAEAVSALVGSLPGGGWMPR
ncbi:ESX secretion-associated protein EspG [Nocardia sp. NPDC019395]|uniref:ESX secretion-associated protein EspG n=1 Tax=Nocardia sp. NPDC019395 TaxID=3154686 RepID=UPI0033CF4B1D